MSFLEDILEDIKELIEEIDKDIGTRPGPLPDPPKNIVAGKLDDTEAKIDQILDPDTIPSLNPPSAGTADTSLVTWDASEYADHYVTMATDARNAIPGDDETCGDNLRTMKHRIDDFRSVCGI